MRLLGVRQLVPVLLAMSLSVVGCTGLANSASEASSGPTMGASRLGSASLARAGLAAVPDIVSQVQPSVVTVRTDHGSGSGVIYTQDGLIVTNEHVVRGSSTVEVALADGQRLPATVRGADEITDLALIHIDRQNLPPARFQSDPPALGGLVVAIGGPLGVDSGVTAAVISGLYREIPGGAATSHALVGLIQIDAPISAGNSGGALVNGTGEVVGISETYAPQQPGMVPSGFAIPSATVVDVVEQLRNTGRASHAFIGLRPAPITSSIAEQFGLPHSGGFIVAGVVPGGPAEAAGIRPGELVSAVNGEDTRSPSDFLELLRQRRPGDAITLTVRATDGTRREVTVVVTDQPAISQ